MPLFHWEERKEGKPEGKLFTLTLEKRKKGGAQGKITNGQDMTMGDRE